MFSQFTETLSKGIASATESLQDEYSKAQTPDAGAPATPSADEEVLASVGKGLTSLLSTGTDLTAQLKAAVTPSASSSAEPSRGRLELGGFDSLFPSAPSEPPVPPR